MCILYFSNELVIEMILQNDNNNSMMQQSIDGQGLPIHCWPLIHLSADRGERSSSQFRGNVWSAFQVPQSLAF